LISNIASTIFNSKIYNFDIPEYLTSEEKLIERVCSIEQKIFEKHYTMYGMRQDKAKALDIEAYKMMDTITKEIVELAFSQISQKKN